MPNYFQIQFSVPGPYSNVFGDSEYERSISRQHATFDVQVEKWLTEEGLEWRHAYSYPDGSCYKFVRTDLDKEQLYKKLSESSSSNKVGIAQIYEADPSDDPMKAYSSTLQEYMDKPQ